MNRLVLVGNFDAEFELLDPASDRSPRRRQLCAELGRLLESELSAVGVEGIVLGPEERPQPDSIRLGHDTPAICWMPTPEALAVLDSLRWPIPDVPGVEVLRRANDRAFAHRVESRLADRAIQSRFHDHPGSAVAAVEALLDEGAVLCKRRLGFAGRMQKRIGPGRFDEAARRWVRGSFDGSFPGLLVEQFVDVVSEWSVHGVLRPDGQLESRGVVGFRADASGAFVEVVSEPTVDEVRLLETQEVVADALHDIGYFGPFAFDAFHFKDSTGRVVLRPFSDLNARLTRSSFAPCLRPFESEWLR